MAEQREATEVPEGITRNLADMESFLAHVENLPTGSLISVDDVSAVLRRVSAESSALQQTVRELTLACMTDPLTRLFNRRVMSKRLSEEVERASRYGSLFSLILMDLDFFKDINDKYGHLVGDDVLRGAAEILSYTMRKTDVCTRWGGEEFLVLTIETDEAQARAAAERIRSRLGCTDFSPVSSVTASFGVAEYRQGDSCTSLLERADRCLYQAKHRGRNRVVSASDADYSLQ